MSNLHLLPDGALVVLDWDYAWAGPRLFNVGQLLRWRPLPVATNLSHARAEVMTRSTVASLRLS